MSVPPIIQYPLDLDGTSLTNKIVAERREITTNTARVFVPKAGPFYTSTFTIINVDTGKELVPVDDYVLAQPFSQASLRSGKDVQCAVVLKVESPITVEMNYQVVGGEYSWNLSALADLITELNLDERPIKWGAIVGRPTMYPAAPHIHDIGDTYGWEYVVWQLERITNAILVGDEASHDELRQQMQFIRDQLQANIDAVDGKLDAHLNDFNNPHKTTKAQVGLGVVENYSVASNAEALAGVVSNRYMTPSLAALLANRLASEAVDAHEAKKNNPHAVTKAQVGLGNVDNFLTATQAQAEAGTAANAFMTPQRTYQAIMVHAGTLIQNHVNDKNNPHNTTKAQVGLGLVDNFQTATQAEAVAGVLSDRFMTPQRTKQAIDAIAGNLIQQHVSNMNNPHNTTKAQVGLGSVENLPLATEGDAQAGTSHSKYMTPMTTLDAINYRAVTPLNTHINNKANPHGVTKAQVGLGNVLDYPIASSAEATGAGVNTRYMTPLRTAELIDARVNPAINAHVNNRSNPHGVTKAQIGLDQIPNGVTRSRGVNSDGYLLTAGGMYDHVNSGDHDARYVKINVAQNTSLRVYGNTLQGFVSGAWRQLWPATWTNFTAPGAADPVAGNSQEISLLNAGGRLYASVSGSWQQVWPPLWQD